MPCVDSYATKPRCRDGTDWHDTPRRRDYVSYEAEGRALAAEEFAHINTEGRLSRKSYGRLYRVRLVSVNLSRGGSNSGGAARCTEP